MTYDCNVNLQRCTYPQRVCKPRLVVRVDQALPDKVSSDHAGNGDNNSGGQQHAHTNTLLQWHAQP
jgi:hypothetical protein